MAEDSYDPPIYDRKGVEIRPSELEDMGDDWLGYLNDVLESYPPATTNEIKERIKNIRKVMRPIIQLPMRQETRAEAMKRLLIMNAKETMNDIKEVIDDQRIQKRNYELEQSKQYNITNAERLSAERVIDQVWRNIMGEFDYDPRKNALIIQKIRDMARQFPFHQNREGANFAVLLPQVRAKLSSLKKLKPNNMREGGGILYKGLRIKIFRK